MEICNLIKKYKKLNLNDNLKNKFFNKHDKNSFKNLYEQCYRYPIYPNHKQGDKLLMYIRNYLISREKNRAKPEYPMYINDKDNNVENEKRYFRNISNNYSIDKNFKL